MIVDIEYIKTMYNIIRTKILTPNQCDTVDVIHFVFISNSRFYTLPIGITILLYVYK